VIYVDDTNNYGAKGLWCHMWSDTNDTDELHAFAARIGLKRSWAQLSRGVSGEFPHYDLRPSKRELALKSGAQYLPLKVWILQRMPKPASDDAG
jgi:hypothetical protein